MGDAICWGGCEAVGWHDVETFDIPSKYRSLLINSVQHGSIVFVPIALRDKLLFLFPPHSAFMIHSTKAGICLTH